MSAYTTTYTLVTLVPCVSYIHYEKTGETYTAGDGGTYERLCEVYYCLRTVKGDRRDGFLVVAHENDRVVGFIDKGDDGWSFQRVRAAYGAAAGPGAIYAKAEAAAALAANARRIEHGQPEIKSMDEIAYLSGGTTIFGKRTRLNCLMAAGYMPAAKSAAE